MASNHSYNLSHVSEALSVEELLKVLEVLSPKINPFLWFYTVGFIVLMVIYVFSKFFYIDDP